MLTITCNALAATHGADFAARAVTLHGRKRHYIAANPDGMISPAPIANTDLWVETNQSAKSILALVQQLLALCGQNALAFSVKYQT